MVIPFYGDHEPGLFAIERSAMDRSGRVIEALNSVLPNVGRVLDIGAGDGFTAERLATREREIVACEPSEGMIDVTRAVRWVQGAAQALPFRDSTFAGAYATWAYFFPTFHDVSSGLDEVDRVTKPGAPVVIVDNAGGDEFTAMAPLDYSADLDYWSEAGFDIRIIETAFVLDSLNDARRLLEFFFGDRARPALSVEYRVAMMVKR